MIPTTGTDSGIQRLCFLFYLNNFHSQKVNDAAETDSSPQVCTVRPRKDAGQCSIGGGGGAYLASRVPFFS